jgi:hypothetical protein
MDDNTNKEQILYGVVQKLKDNGMPEESILDISRDVSYIAFNDDEESRWKAKQEIFSIVFREIV